MPKFIKIFFLIIFFTLLYNLKPVLAIPNGTLLYRSSAGGKIYGYNTNELFKLNLIGKNKIKVNSGHVGIYIGKEKGIDYVVEAVNNGIQKTPAKYFINKGIGEKFIGAKIPLKATKKQRDKVVMIAEDLAKKQLKYDFDFKNQKGPKSGQWTCVGLTEKLYESANINIKNNHLAYNPANYAINITPDGYDDKSIYNPKTRDVFSRLVEYSKISRRPSLGEIIGFNCGKEHNNKRYFFLPYTQFIQPSLKNVKVDILISSDFSENKIRGIIPLAKIILSWAKNNAVSSSKIIKRKARKIITKNFKTLVNKFKNLDKNNLSQNSANKKTNKLNKSAHQAKHSKAILQIKKTKGRIAGEQEKSQPKPVAKTYKAQSKNIKKSVLRLHKHKIKKIKNKLTPPVSNYKKKDYHIKKVIDGDTLELLTGELVRYIGIDAPELNKPGPDDDQCLAWSAKLKNIELLGNGKLYLKKDSGGDKDKYGRLLRYVYSGNLFVNQELVKKGLAKVFLCQPFMKDCPVMKNKKLINKLIKAENYAKKNKLGLWSDTCKKQKLNKKQSKIRKINIPFVKPITTHSTNIRSSPVLIFSNGSDTLAPETFLTKTPAKISSSTKANFEFNCNEKNCVFQYKLDNHNWQESISPLTLTNLTDGEHNFFVKAIDNAKNIDKTPAEYKWLVDTIPPISIMQNLSPKQAITTINLAWSGDDNGSGLSYYQLKYKINNSKPRFAIFNNGNIVASSSKPSFTKATSTKIIGKDGEHFYFFLRAIDKAGNIENWTENNNGNAYTYVDIYHPHIPTIISPINNQIISTNSIDVIGIASSTDCGDLVKLKIFNNNGNNKEYSAISTIASTTCQWSINNVNLPYGSSTISAFVQESDGDQSLKTNINIERVGKKYGFVVFNEIAWAGTQANYRDEWIELYNNTGHAQDLTNWTIKARDGSPNITITNSTTTISSYGYYLLERRKDGNAVKNVSADWFGSFGNGLNNNGEYLELRDENNYLVDYIDCGKGWFAGDKSASSSRRTMEKINPSKNGNDKTNWETSKVTTTTSKFKDAGNYPILGTPRALNSVINSKNEPHKETYIITKNTTWRANDSPVIIKDYFYLGKGAILTIEPGVIVKIKNNNFYLDLSGKIIAQGTSLKPIVFTSYQDDEYGGDTNEDKQSNGSPGNWAWLQFNPDSAGSVLNNVIIRYGGIYQTMNSTKKDAQIQIENANVEIKNSIIEDGADGGIKLTNSSSTIDNCLIQNNKYGILINNNKDKYGPLIDSDNPTISNNIIKNNIAINTQGDWNKKGYGIMIKNQSKAKIINNKIQNNDREAIWIDNSYPELSNNVLAGNLYNNAIRLSGTISQDYILSGDNVYLLGNENHIIAASSTLTIEPGAIIKFMPSMDYDNIYINGKLNVNGNKDKPVVFTSYQDDEYGGDTNEDGTSTKPNSGDWSYIDFNSNQKSEINYAIIRYGGHYNTSNGGSYIEGQIKINKGEVNISNSIIENGNGYGIELLSNATSTISNCDIKKNIIGIEVSNSANATVNNSNIYNNSKYGINNTGDNIVKAQGNWWGDEKGPIYNDSANASGQRDKVSDKVDYKNWLKEKLNN